VLIYRSHQASKIDWSFMIDVKMDNQMISRLTPLKEKEKIIRGKKSFGRSDAFLRSAKEPVSYLCLV